jgi:hypothetical protein
MRWLYISIIAIFILVITVIIASNFITVYNGIEQCKEAGYVGIKFISKYNLNFICSN